MTDTLDIALIQTRTPATAAAGLAHVEPLIRQAAAEGAQLILGPLLADDVRATVNVPPMDNTQMVAQMAQFSSVAGISEMNKSLTGISNKLGSTSASDAMSYVGKNGKQYVVLTIPNPGWPNASTYAGGGGAMAPGWRWCPGRRRWLPATACRWCPGWTGW